MATTADYLTQLQADKQTLVDNLVAKGVEATSDETFTTLAPKVADIQSGGGDFEITNASYLFYTGVRIDIVEELCNSISDNCSSFRYMFNGCSQLTEIPELNTSSGKDFGYMFYSCSKLTKIPKLNTSNGTNFQNMFQNCRQLTEIPQLDTSNGTDFQNMFYGCSSLVTLPLIDTSKNNNFTYFCSGCSQLTEIPELNTSNATIFDYMFNNCTNLSDLPLIDMSSSYQHRSMFARCSNLTNLSGLKDLGKAYKTTSSASNNYYKLDLSDCTLLTHDSLMNVINNLYDIATAGVQPQDLVIATECQELLTDEEVSVAVNKGWNVSFA